MTDMGMHTPSPTVVTVGSGNQENVLCLEGEIRLGQKHLVSASELIGGSCINYFLRLAAAGIGTFPIPLVGEDAPGIQIQSRLLQICHSSGLEAEFADFIASADFLIPGIQTAKSTIVVDQGRRTIFSQSYTGSASARNHIVKRFKSLSAKIEDASLIVGHVPLDNEPRMEGLVTKDILALTPQNWLVLINPGPGQYTLGLNFWEGELALTDIIQLNLFEFKKMFGNSGRSNSLIKIIHYLSKAAATAVITLNKFGAIGLYKGRINTLVVAAPLPVENVVDPTGAGDAFATGMIAALDGNKSFSFEQFVQAIRNGRLWASYACTTLGASGSCPSAEQLTVFENAIPCQKEVIDIIDGNADRALLEQLEKSY